MCAFAAGRFIDSGVNDALKTCRHFRGQIQDEIRDFAISNQGTQIIEKLLVKERNLHFQKSRRSYRNLLYFGLELAISRIHKMQK